MITYLHKNTNKQAIMWKFESEANDQLQVAPCGT